MTRGVVLKEIGKLWKQNPKKKRLMQLIMDALQDNTGLFLIYELTDKQLLKLMKRHYKSSPERG